MGPWRLRAPLLLSTSTELSDGTEAGLRDLGRRYAVFMRTTALAAVSVAALVQAAPDRRPLVGTVVAGLAAWSVGYAVAARRARASRTARFGSQGWLLTVDTLVVSLLCLTQRWTVPPDALGDSTNWVLAIVTVTVVAHQWLTTTVGGVLLTTVIVAAHLAGDALLPTGEGAGVLGLWTFAEAGLSRALFLLVRAGARRADRTMVASEKVRRVAAVAAARRADEREYLAVLHDTSAATLLAVGARMVDGSEPWLAEQAARDLEILTGQSDLTDGDTETDLVRLLDQVVRQAPVAVEVRSPPAVPMPAVRAAAVSAATREALTNVTRHAGVNSAAVTVRRTGDRIIVEIADRGRGFAPEQVSPYRRGVSRSITQRMASVGGQATVTSRPGAGTRVRLEVPGD